MKLMKSNKKNLIGLAALILIVLGLVFASISYLNHNSKDENNPQNSMSQKTSESPTFVNTTWTASSIENKNLEENTSITVQFDDQGKLTGFDGCNTFNGSYEIDGSNLKINPNLISTKKACEGNVMKQADIFNELLLSSTSYKLGDGSMILLQGKEEGLSFNGSVNALAKTSWIITGYNNGKEAVVSPIIDTVPTIVFAEDGIISGSVGCNTYTGTYEVSGDSISIGSIAATQRECIEPEGIMEQESSLLSYLEKADTWLIQGNMLFLRTAEDQIAITALNSSSIPN